MILTLDAGNSALKGALFEDQRLVEVFRLDRRAQASPEAWESALRPHLEDRQIVRSGLVSVVPAMTAALREVLPRLAGVELFVIDHQIRLPFQVAYQTPHTLGTDRLAAAAAAFVAHGQDGRGVVALDAGTALTLEVIDGAGIYQGGIIGAGPALLRDALAGGTAQLPPVPLALPPTPVGRSTQEALQAGILYGFLEGVQGLLRRIAAHLGETPTVVATGGWSAFLADHLPEIDYVEPHLVLRGVRVLMEEN